MNKIHNNSNSSDSNIINLIIDDHKPLKELIEAIKNPNAELEERRQAFEDFVPALLTHAKAEEKSLYSHMKKEDDLRTEGFEGEAEHNVAIKLVEEAHTPTEDELWAARVKVLAELVENHIKEEENEFFPMFKRYAEPAERVRLGEQYLQMKSKLQAIETEIHGDPIKESHNQKSATH